MQKSVALGLLLFLIACTPGTSTVRQIENKDRAYPYFTSMPSAQDFKEKYQNIHHDLSPISRYRFRMSLPADWKTLDIRIDKELAKGEFLEMGVFRQPGEWMNNEKTPQDAEVTISAVEAGSDTRTSADWLQETIQKNVPNVALLEKRTAGSGKSEAADMLFSYNDGTQVIITRMAAYRDNDRFIVISASASDNGYRDLAEAFYVAIATFQLDEQPKENPFLDL